MTLLRRLATRDDGQDLIEYSLLCALISVTCILAMNALATDINEVFARAGAALDAAGF